MAAALAACNSVMKLAASPMLPKRPRFAARLALMVVGGPGHAHPLLLQLLEVLVEVLQQVL